ncbi:precorrin-2 dehydrogenase/sirohydrochlorin ferrochelatase family protein [Paenibacillus alkalitolerans]|uniref:precorrin-2 dehydrogenase/sirohydrochlorin ferrochelatase family protein n=1 Tax=Paenibacillus alkalitolerans TaxID=2799335 RepID=UPI0018F6A445|nr:NAD(P)-dependent oxidoreductase [Paenibacillus alkalitolerans]
MMEQFSTYYPLMLHLRRRRCVVVGGGKIGWRRTKALLEAGANVVVVSPDAVRPLMEAAEEGKLAWERRTYRVGDLAGAALAFAATNDPAANEAVASEAASLGVWITVADDPERSDFIVPSVVRRGRLTISLTTGGASPLLTRKIAGEISAAYGEEYAAYTEVLARLRRRIKNEIDDPALRHDKLELLLDMDLLSALGGGESPDEAENRAWTALTSV